MNSTAHIIRNRFAAIALGTALVVAPVAGIIDAPAASAARVQEVDPDTCENGDWGWNSDRDEFDYCHNYRANSSGNRLRSFYVDIALSKDMKSADKRWLRETFTHSTMNSNRDKKADLGYIIEYDGNFRAGQSCPTLIVRGERIHLNAIAKDGTFLKCSSSKKDGRLTTTRR